MDQNSSSTSSFGIARIDGRVIEHDECESRYVIPQRRQIHLKKEGLRKSERPNNITINQLVFRSDNCKQWDQNDIVFLKRNIVWKAIKYNKTQTHDNAETSQNKDLTGSLQISADQIYDHKMNDMLAAGRYLSCNSLSIDDKHFKNVEDDDSSSSDSSDDETIWDENTEILCHKMSELDVYVNKSYTNIQEERKYKTVKQISNVADIPEEVPKYLFKYWIRRYELFHKFDEGIQLDQESWYSVTPERIAKQIARRCKCNVIVDAFCGAGGNAIQFALTCNKVIAIDIDAKKIELARNNAKVYGVEGKIKFIVGDFLELAPELTADIIFLSPPWGGPLYTNVAIYDLKCLLPVGGKKIFKAANKISKSVAYFVPKNINLKQVRMLAKKGQVETELYLEGNRPIAMTCYYGGLITRTEWFSDE